MEITQNTISQEDTKINIFLYILFLIINFILLSILIIITKNILFLPIIIVFLIFIVINFLIYKLYSKKTKSLNIFFSITGVFIIVLLMFRFLYYEKHKYEYEIPKDFYNTKYKNVNINDSDNLYISLKKNQNKYKNIEHKYGKLKIDIKNCIYNNNCYKFDVYKNKLEQLNNDKKIELNSSNETYLKGKIEIQLVKNKLNKYKDIIFTFNDKDYDILENDFLTTFFEKKYFKHNVSDQEIIVLTNYIGFYRESNNKILYYLENKQEEKAIELINAQIHFAYTMLEGDASLIDTLVGITILKISIDNISLIVDNFKLTEVNKDIIIKSLSVPIEKSMIDNSMKNEIKQMNENLRKSYEGGYLGENYDLYAKTTLFNIEDVLLLGNMRKYKIIQNGGGSCTKQGNTLKLNDYFKSNIIGLKLMVEGDNECYTTQYKKLFELEDIRKQVIEKLQKN